MWPSFPTTYCPKLLQTAASVFWRSTLQKYFGTGLPFTRFCWNTVAFSSLSLLPLLTVYIFLAPGFATLLATNTTALSRFARQILTNGLPVVFLINYIGFFAASIFLREDGRSTYRYIFADAFLRAIVFVGLHVAIYVLSAFLFNSFGGDRGTAFKVVGPTLERAYLFANISGVYLYATLPGACITYLAALQVADCESQIAERRSIFALEKIVLVSANVILISVVTLVSAGMTLRFGKP